jgi:nucleotide-binding universal stress UspA family protein
MTPKQRLDILLADDGSQHAQAAVRLLQDLPLPEKTEILVCRAFESDQIQWVPEFERSLEETKEQLSSRGYGVETELQMGSPSEKILEIAEERKPGLIVMGAKGLRSTVSILLGGVAQQVVEYSCCPVLIVRAPYRRLAKVLLVTDGSPSSQEAARFLGGFCLPAGVELHAMHVLRPIPLPIIAGPYLGAWSTVTLGDPGPEVNAEETRRGEELLNTTLTLLERDPAQIKTVLVRGDAATEIIDYAGKEHVDLIVAGSRGLGQFKSLWVGSVSRKLVHYSDCSVLLVKQPAKE